MAPYIGSTIDSRSHLPYPESTLFKRFSWSDESWSLIIGCVLVACSGQDKHEKRLLNYRPYGSGNGAEQSGSLQTVFIWITDRFGHDRNTVTDRLFPIVSEMEQLDVRLSD